MSLEQPARTPAAATAAQARRTRLPPKRRSLIIAGRRDLLWLGNQKLADLAAKHGADDVEILELQRGRMARPQARHLAGRDPQPMLGQAALQLRRFSDFTPCAELHLMPGGHLAVLRAQADPYTERIDAFTAKR